MLRIVVNQLLPDASESMNRCSTVRRIDHYRHIQPDVADAGDSALIRVFELSYGCRLLRSIITCPAINT